MTASADDGPPTSEVEIALPVELTEGTEVTGGTGGASASGQSEAVEPAAASTWTDEGLERAVAAQPVVNAAAAREVLDFVLERLRTIYLEERGAGRISTDGGRS